MRLLTTNAPSKLDEMIPLILLVTLTLGGVALGFPASTIVMPQLPDFQVTQGPIRPTPRQTAQPTYNTPPPSGKCSVTCRKQFEYLADPCNCECFYQCTFVGKPPTHYKCPAGLRWNTRSMACDHLENVQCTADGGQYITGGGVYTGVMGANNGAGRLGDWNAKLCCDGDSGTQQVIQGTGTQQVIQGSGQIAVGTGTRQVPVYPRVVPPANNYGTRQVPPSNYGTGTRQVPGNYNQQQVVVTDYQQQQKEWFKQWKESNPGTGNVVSGSGTKQVPSGSGSWSGSMSAGSASIKGGSGTRQIISSGTKQVVVGGGGGSSATKQVVVVGGGGGGGSSATKQVVIGSGSIKNTGTQQIVSGTKTRVVNVIKTGGTRQVVTSGSATQQGGRGTKQVIGGSVVGIQTGNQGIKAPVTLPPPMDKCVGSECNCPPGMIGVEPFCMPDPNNAIAIMPTQVVPLPERCRGEGCRCPKGMIGFEPFCMPDPNLTNGGEVISTNGQSIKGGISYAEISSNLMVDVVLTAYITSTSTGGRISHPTDPVEVKLRPHPRGGINVTVVAPLMDMPRGGPRNCLSPITPCVELADYESLSVVFLAKNGEWALELMLGAHGHYVVQLYDGYGQNFTFNLPVVYDHSLTIDGEGWRGEARIPTSYLPPVVTKFNAFYTYGVEGADGGGQKMALESLFPATEATRDAKAFEFFQPLNMAKIDPENWKGNVPKIWKRRAQ